MPTSDAPFSSTETPPGGNDLESLLARIHQIADGAVKPGPGGGAPGTAAAPPSPVKSVRQSDPAEIHARPARSTPSLPSADEEGGHWRPLEPQSLKSAGLSEGQV